MENTSYIALSRQMTLRTELEIVANNIANANTSAYKGEKMVFREFLTKATSKTPEQLSFVQDIGLARDFSEGPLQSTGNSLDIAINGEGYFSLETPAGTRYSRQGHFQLDAESNLVNSKGFPVSGVNGIINIPQDEGEIHIASDGTISTEFSDNIAQLRIVTFEDQQAMSRSAHGLYTTEEEPDAVNSPNLVQGALENSNVQPILEMSRMMTLLREYQSVQNFVKKEHDRQEKAIQRLARVN